MNMSWFSKPKAAKPVVRIIDRDISLATVTDWRSNEGYCNEAAKLLAHPVLARMLQVLNNTHPAFTVLTLGNIEDRAVQQAKCEGYTMCLEDLKSMAVFIRPFESVESTFKEEEISARQMQEYGHGNE